MGISNPAMQLAPTATSLLAAIGQIKLDTTDPNRLAMQLTLLQELQANRVPAEQLPQVMAALGLPLPAPPPVAPIQPVQHASQFALPSMINQAANGSVANAMQGKPEDIHPGQMNAIANANANANGQPERNDTAELNRQKHRQRSRSPDAKRRRVSPPNRRKSPVYGAYDPNAAISESNQPPPPDRPEFERKGGKKGKGNQGRNRTSPARGPPKRIGMDKSLAPGCIRGVFHLFLTN